MDYTEHVKQNLNVSKVTGYSFCFFVFFFKSVVIPMYMLSVAGYLVLIQKNSTYKVPQNGGVLVLSKYL